MLQVAAAFMVDLIVGDPRKIPHPVVLIGKGIDILEKYLRRWAAPLIGLKGSGVILTMITVGLTYAVMWGAAAGANRINYWFGAAVSVWFLSTTMAAKCLGDAAMDIYNLLAEGNITEARKKVGWIVGRDTDNLDEGELTRATVETVAENVVDGIVAPLFYAFIGGLPLAMAYKAVNTLDSMVGYKNEKYREFGWASARLDDIANYIPARVTGIIMLVAFWLMGKPVKRAVQTLLRDAPMHPSPNSGIPEAAVAGALGIRLGGVNFYGGVQSVRAYMGEPVEKLERTHIYDTVRLMRVTSVIAVLLGTAVVYGVSRLFGIIELW